MNVGQLIEELRKLPQHVPVLAVLDSIIMPVENGEAQIVPLTIDDSLEVTDARWEGSHVLLWADGMHR